MALDFSILAKLGLDTSQFSQNLGKAEGLVGKFKGVMGQIGLSLSAGAAIGFFKTIVDDAGKIADFAKAADISAESLQGLSYAAKLGGVEQEALVKALSGARVKLDELASGNEAAAKTFQKLGLSQKDFIGLSTEQSLEKIAAAYAGASDQAGSLDAITEIIGKGSGPKLLQVLEQLGTEGFPKMTDAAREAGQVIEGDLITQLDDVGDRFDTLLGSLKTAGASILGTFLGIGEKIGTAFGAMVYGTDAAVDAVEKVAAKAAEASEKVAKVAKAAITPATTAEFEKLADVLDKISEKGKTNAELADKYLNKYLTAVAEATKYQKESHEYVTKVTEAEQYHLKWIELQSAEYKKRQDLIKASADTLASAELEAAKRKFDALPIEDRILKTQKAVAELKSEEQAITRELVALKKSGNQSDETSARIAELTVRLNETKTEELEAQFQVQDLTIEKERQETEEAAKQLAIEEQITGEKRTQIGITRNNSGMSNFDMSDEQLKQKRFNLSKQLTDLVIEKVSDPRGHSFINAMMADIKSQLASLDDELDRRRNFRSRVDQVGESKARNFYPGSVDFDKMLQQYVNGIPEAAKQTELLKKIDDRLAGKFKNA